MNAAETRELLELAAKAHGGIDRCEDYGWIDDSKDTPTQQWAPLTDDGDALRLAMKLHFNIEIGECNKSVFVAAPGGGYDEQLYEWHGDDIGKATRLAVLRAAAAIGRAMP